MQTAHTSTQCGDPAEVGVISAGIPHTRVTKTIQRCRGMSEDQKVSGTWATGQRKADVHIYLGTVRKPRQGVAEAHTSMRVVEAYNLGTGGVTRTNSNTACGCEFAQIVVSYSHVAASSGMACTLVLCACVCVG